MRKEIVEHFQKTWKEFDKWFDTHRALYLSELAALKKAGQTGTGLEIGVGTGRFAAPLAVRFGLDPAINMLKLAKKRGVQSVQGLGENLPFKNESFHFVQIIFVIEFVADILSFLKEAARTLKRDGVLILGFIDKNSQWGLYYARNATHRKFFHPPSPEEILSILKKINLEYEEVFQTLFQPPPDIEHEEEPRSGFGRGGFVVLTARKKLS
ncbi:MAG: methyltransferase domain-containing protein [Candidatus Aminicenantales bacterium]